MAKRPDIPFLANYGWVGSASAISTFQLCQRKWAYAKIDKIEDPGSAATELGSDVDDNYLQPYVTEGREFNLETKAGQIASAARHLLVKGPTQRECQKHIIIPSPTNPRIAYQGWVDQYLEGVVPEVTDFKTTGDLQWAKSADDLRDRDPQALLYAHWALRGGYHSWAEQVDPIPHPPLWRTEPAHPHGGVELQWLYVTTKKPYKSKRVHLQIWQGDTDERFAALDRVGQTIADAKASAKSALDLPPNLELGPDNWRGKNYLACDAFGGCAYKARCHAVSNQPKTLAQQLGTNDTMLDPNLLASLNANVNAAAPLAPAPSSGTLVPSPSAVPPPPASPIVFPVGGAAPMVTLVTQPPITPGPVPTPVVIMAQPQTAHVPGTPMTEAEAFAAWKAANAAALAASGAGTAINPPESTLDPASVPQPPAADLAAIEAAGEDDASASDTPATAGKPKRTRRTKAQIEADNAAAAAAQAAKQTMIPGVDPAGPAPSATTTYVVNVEGNAAPTLAKMAEDVRALADASDDIQIGKPMTASTVTAFWGREKYGAQNYSSCEIGPFSMTTEVLPNETPTDALERAYKELDTLACRVRNMKLEAFSANVGRLIK